MIGKSVAHYSILEKLGEGGMGVVYKARDAHLDRFVALKVLPPDKVADPERTRRFVQEAKSASALNHPNIITIYDISSDSGHDFIAMEYVAGKTLDQLIPRKGMRLNEALKFAVQITDALARAHAAGILHRDVKPANIMVDEHGLVKVLDFGLAKLMEQGPSENDPTATIGVKTEEGTIIGTVAYMSPEQAEGKKVDARSDIFSFGVVLYEMMSGQRPFQGDSRTSILAAIIHQKPAPLSPNVPRDLDKIVARCLRKDPSQRFQNMADLKVALEELKAESDSGELESSAASPPGSEVRGLPRAISISLNRRVLGALLAIILAVAAWALWPRRVHQPLPEARRWYELGAAAIRDGAYYRALVALERATSLDRLYVLAHARLAEALAELEYSEKAKESMLRAVAGETGASRLETHDKLLINAINFTITRDFSSAIQRYLELVRIAPDAAKAAAYVDLGRAYEKNEQISKALESYAEACRRDPQLPSAFARQGRLYSRQLKVDQAAAAFAQADSLYQALGDLEGLTEVYCQRAFLAVKVSKLAEGRAAAEKALQMARATSNEYQQISALLLLSTVASRQGSTAEAEEKATAGIELARKSGIPATRGLIDLGNVLFARGDTAKAEVYFREAFDYAQRNNLRRHQARAVFSLGSLHIQQGRVEEGLPEVRQALTYYQEAGFRQESGLALILIARAYRQKGQYGEALKAFQQQLALAQETKDRTSIAFAREGIASVLSAQERFPEALAEYQQVYAEGKATGNSQRTGYASLNCAGSLWQLGRQEEARQMIAEADKLGLKALVPLVWKHRAKMALGQGQFAAAVAAAHRALEVTGAADRSSATELKVILGRALVASGAKREGRKTCEEAVSVAAALSDADLAVQADFAMAYALLETGEAKAALPLLAKVRETLDSLGKRESLWRAWVVAARAHRRAGDEMNARECLRRAATIHAQLRDSWGPDAFAKYLGRPDIQGYERELRTIR